MRNPVLVGAAVAAAAVLVLAGAGVAMAAPPADIYTPAPATGGVTQAAANTVCAAIVGKPAPSTTNEAAFRAAANTPSGSDDTGFEGKVVQEWQDLIVTQETHRDHLGAYGLDDSKTISCKGAEAKLPQLKLAKDVQATICATARLDLIAKPAVKARVAAALGVLKRNYADARSDCPPPATTTPTPTPTPSATPAPTTTPADDNNGSGPLYATCAEASAAGAAPLASGDLGYRLALDSDGDGTACELPVDPSALPVGGANTGA